MKTSVLITLSVLFLTITLLPAELLSTPSYGSNPEEVTYGAYVWSDVNIPGNDNQSFNALELRLNPGERPFDNENYVGECEDPWFSDTLVVGGADFTFYVASKNTSYWNPADDGDLHILLLLAYHPNTTGDPTSGLSFDLSTPGGSLTSVYPGGEWDDPPLEWEDYWSGGRPGDGESGIYKKDETSVLFIDLDAVMTEYGDEIEVNISNLSFTGADPATFRLHFDAYGYILDSATGGRGKRDKVVKVSNAASGDLTTAIPEASTLLLFGFGIIGLVGAARKLTRKYMK